MMLLRAAVVVVVVAAAAALSESTDVATDTWELDLQQETATTIWPDIGCQYNGSWFAPGEVVPSDEPCLNCSCMDETLVCHLRVCPHVPDPVPDGCYVIKKESECCGQVVCEKDLESNRLIRKESALEDGAGEGEGALASWWGDAPTAEDGVLGTRRRGSVGAVSVNGTVKGCVAAGAVFAEGSAMVSPDECSYCFCIKGHRRCVAPKCLLPVSGCRPRYRAFSCCPAYYDCQDAIATTTTTARSTHDCVVEGRHYSSGARVDSSGGPCESCFCLAGEVRCATTTCAPPLEGCVPVMQAGRCCPVKYNCDGDTSKDQLLKLIQAKVAMRQRGPEDWHANMARRSASGDGVIVDTSDSQLLALLAEAEEEQGNEAVTETDPEIDSETEQSPTEEEPERPDPPSRRLRPTRRPLSRVVSRLTSGDLAKRRSQSRYRVERPPTRILRPTRPPKDDESTNDSPVESDLPVESEASGSDVPEEDSSASSLALESNSSRPSESDSSDSSRPTRLTRPSRPSRPSRPFRFSRPTRPGGQSLSSRFRLRYKPGQANETSEPERTSFSTTSTSTTTLPPVATTSPSTTTASQPTTVSKVDEEDDPTTINYDLSSQALDESLSPADPEDSTTSPVPAETTSSTTQTPTTTTTPSPEVSATTTPTASSKSQAEAGSEAFGNSGVGEVFWLEDVHHEEPFTPPSPPEFSAKEPVKVSTGMNVKGSLKNAIKFGPVYILDNRVRTDRQHRADNETETETTAEGEEVAATDVPVEETTLLTKETTASTKDVAADNENEVTHEETTAITDKAAEEGESPVGEHTTLLAALLAQETTIKSLGEESVSSTIVPSDTAVEEGASSSTFATTQDEGPVTDDFSYADIEFVDPDEGFPSYDITVGTSVMASPPQTQPVGVGEVIPVDLGPQLKAEADSADLGPQHKAEADSIDLDPEHKSPEELESEQTGGEELEPATESPRPSILGTLLNYFTRPDRPERPRPPRPPLRPSPFSPRPGPGLGRPRPGLPFRRPGLEGRPRPGQEFRPRPEFDGLPPPPPPPGLEGAPPPPPGLKGAPPPPPELEARPPPEIEDRIRTEAETSTAPPEVEEVSPLTDTEEAPEPETVTRPEEEERPRPGFRPRPGILNRPRPGGSFVPPRFRFTPATTQDPATEPSVTTPRTAEPSSSTDSLSLFTLPANLPEPIHNNRPPIVPIRPEFAPARPEVAPIRPIGPFSRPAVGGSSDLPSKPIMEGGFQGIRDEGEGVNPTFDYIDYDSNGEPTLPPSLPNLRIIPFVAADALTNKDAPVSFGGDDFRSTPRPPPFLPLATDDEANDITQPETTDAPATTTRRSLIRPSERRPPVLPARLPFRPSSDDTTTRRPFLGFRRPGDRTTRKPFVRPSDSEDEGEEEGDSSRPGLPFSNRDRPFSRPAFIPPRRPSTSPTTTEPSELPTEPPTVRTTSTAPPPSPELPLLFLTTRPPPAETTTTTASTTTTTTPATTTTTTTTTSRPIQSDDINNLLLQDDFKLPDSHSVAPVRFTPARPTPKPIRPVKLPTALPEIPPAVRDQLPLAIDPVLASGLLKLSGCNFYGRMYGVGQRIPELSANCKECQCTPVGVQCLPVC